MSRNQTNKIILLNDNGILGCEAGPPDIIEQILQPEANLGDGHESDRNAKCSVINCNGVAYDFECSGELGG